MTSAIVSVNNLKSYKYDTSHVLAFGELNIDINHTDSFEIDGAINQNSHIVLCNSNLDYIFKREMMKTCVKKSYEVNIYDHLGTTLNRYLKNRSDNNHGTVSNKLVNMELFSQIILPPIKKGEKLYLVIDSYSALNNVLLDRSKQILINQDLQKFVNNNKKYNMIKTVSLYIDAALYNKCQDYIEFRKYFLDVHVASKPTECLVEYLMGSIISTCNKKIQGQLEINKNVTSILTNDCSTSVVCRNNGVIQFNTNNGSERFNFIIIMEQLDDNTEPIQIKYRDTLIAEAKELDGKYSNITFKTINEMTDGIMFYNQLKSLEHVNISNFLMNNSKKVVHYLLSNGIVIGDFKTDPLQLVLKYKKKFYTKIKELIQNEINTGYYEAFPVNSLQIKNVPTSSIQGLHREYSVSRM